MGRIAGVKYDTDVRGKRRKVTIDLNRYGDNEVLSDFLDGLDAMEEMDKEGIPWSLVKERECKKRGITI
ncbi:hypothetical protein [Viscerimonas tarda]